MNSWLFNILGRWYFPTWCWGNTVRPFRLSMMILMNLMSKTSCQMTDENYDDDNNEWEYYYRLLSIQLQMVELSLESSVYKLIYNSSHYLLDISYHYFKPMFLNIFIFSQAMLVLFLMSSWSFGYFGTTKSQILIPAVLCALHLEIEKKVFN